MNAMYVLVQLLNGSPKLLTYQVPQRLIGHSLIGKIVEIPVRDSLFLGMILQQDNIKKPSFLVKEIHAIARVPRDPIFNNYLKKLASCYFIKPLALYQRLQQFLHQPTKKKQDQEILPEVTIEKSMHTIEHLTEEQKTVVNYLIPILHHSRYAPTLLHGVTGSGKTEVYKALIEETIALQKTIILLLPEVSLSMRFQRLLKEQLPSITIHGFHAGATPPEKKALWQDLLAEKPVLIIGVHLPILLPISNLGLIIIDEEHEHFQEMHHPKINSKDAAILRAYIYNIPILLGSATPSLTSLAHVQQKKWAFFQLKKRFIGSFVTIEQVSLLDRSTKKRPFFWISNQLQQAITECLERKEQAIIYLNRRGYSFFVQCKTCSFIFECPNCSVSLTLHRYQDATTAREQLRCHYCNYAISLKPACPSCKAPEDQLLKKGIGTQQVTQMLQKLFPQARIERADLDVTAKKNAWQETIAKFHQGDIDILVGTKTITKGYHFRRVTLVGIIWADLTLHFPDYAAAETTLQQLIQVAGRAGREDLPGKVIVQSMQQHEIFNFIDETSYLAFATAEMELRKELNYPPFCRLVSLELQHKNDLQVEQDAQKLANHLHMIQEQQSLNVTILGPAQPGVWKVQKVHMRHLYLKAPSFETMKTLQASIDYAAFKSSISIVLH